MRRRRNRDREWSDAIVDNLRSIADRLRAGASLRQALIASAGSEGSPFHPVAAALIEGRALAGALHAGAVALDDADLASACCILAVHSDAGGDPLPAVRGLTQRISRRAAAREEARAFSTQARLGARAILLLTPAFLGLVALSDPGGAVHWFMQPRTRVAIVAGLVLQGAGAWWIGAIVGNIARGETLLGSIPLVRALRAILVGRSRSQTDLHVAACAETMALASDAGLSATAATSAVAPYVRDGFGDALRVAVGDLERPLHDSVSAATTEIEGDAIGRFTDALRSSIELGVPLAPALRSLADDIYERASLRLAEDVRRASIRVLLPLGVLILPAFVLACLVPLFVGGLEQIAG